MKEVKEVLKVAKEYLDISKEADGLNLSYSRYENAIHMFDKEMFIRLIRSCDADWWLKKEEDSEFPYRHFTVVEDIKFMFISEEPIKFKEESK